MAFGQEVGQVSVRVIPDATGFKAKLKADLEKLAHTVKVQIPTELDFRGVTQDLAKLRAQVEREKLQVRTELDAQHVAADSARIRSEVDDRPIQIPVELDKRSVRSMMSSLSTLVTRGGGISALGIAAGASIPNMLALAGSITQVAGVAALLPAAGAAGAAAIGALALGLHGFGQALKDMGKPAKFAADLKELAPPARAAALEIKKLHPQLTALRKSVQGELFAGMAGELESLSTTVLPVLQQRLGGVARALSALGRQAVDTVKQSASLDGLHDILKNTQGAIAQLAPGVKPFITALGQLGQTGSKYLPGIAQALASAAQNFGAFIDYAQRSGKIDQWISTGGAALKDLADLALGAGQAIFGIVRAAQKAGGGTLHMLSQGLNQVANVINSPAFQKGLGAFFSGFMQGFHGLMQGLKPVGSLFASLAPIVGKLASQLGPILGQALSAVAGAVKDLLPALKPLLSVLTTTLGGAVKAAAPVLGALAKVLGGVLAAAFNAIKPVLPVVVKAMTKFGTAIADSLPSVLPILKPLAKVLGGALVTAVGALAPLLPQLAQSAKQMVPAFKQLMPEFTHLFKVLTPLIPPIAKLAGKIVKLMLAIEPYEIEALALTLHAVSEVVPPLVKLVKLLAHWIGKLIDWAARMATKGQKSFNDFTTSAKHALDRAYKAVVNWGRNAYHAVADWLGRVRDVTAGILARWRAAVARQVGDVKAVFHTLASIPGQVARYFSRMASAAGDQIGRLIGVVRGIPGRVRGALGNLGGILYSAGQSIIEGLVNGIRSAIGRIRDVLSSVTSMIPDWKGPPSKDRKLLFNAGQLVMQGFSDGIDSRVPKLHSQLAGLTADLSGVRASSNGPGVPSSIAAATGAAGPAVQNNYYGTVGLDERKLAELQDRKWQSAMVVAGMG